MTSEIVPTTEGGREVWSEMSAFLFDVEAQRDLLEIEATIDRGTYFFALVFFTTVSSVTQRLLEKPSIVSDLDLSVQYQTVLVLLPW